MELLRRQFLSLASGTAALPVISRIAKAQAYPNKPVKLILPFLPGTPNDVIARTIAPALSSRLGQPVIVDNRPGGGTSIGTKAVMTADPDGHTLLVSSSDVHVIAQPLNRNVTYDPIKDFAPIASIASTSWVLVIAPSVPAKSLQEFVAYTKANPGKINMGFGQGTGPHLVGEIFKKATGAHIAGIPYKGGTQAITDMLGGQIHMNFGVTARLLPLIREGKLHALAVTSAKRSVDLPEVPTMAESGVAGMILNSTVGILAPIQTAAVVINRLNAEINESVQRSELKASLLKAGYEPRIGSSQDFATLLVDEMQKWLPIAKEIGFSMD